MNEGKHEMRIKSANQSGNNHAFAFPGASAR